MTSTGMTSTTLHLDVEGGQLPADLHVPSSGRGPGVVLFQEIFGVTDYVTSRAHDLAQIGYVVLVPHLYWRLGDQVVQEGGDGLGEAMALVGRFDWDAGVRDGAAALAALQQRDEVDGPVASSASASAAAWPSPSRRTRCPEGGALTRWSATTARPCPACCPWRPP